jgi:carbon starvation protein CstA
VRFGKCVTYAAFFESSQQELSKLIYRGFFARVKPFWTVLDPIDYLSLSESVG